MTVLFEFLRALSHKRLEYFRLKNGSDDAKCLGDELILAVQRLLLAHVL